MAESSCSEMSNNQNTQSPINVVPKINKNEDNSDKTDVKVMKMDPILLDDYKYGETPQTVVNLLECFQSSGLSPNKNDILAGFIRILMLESGFVDAEYADTCEESSFSYEKLLNLTKTLPNDWKRDANYRFNFVLNSGPQYLCTITCMTFGDDFVVNCIIRNLENFSIILDPLTYIASSVTTLGQHTFQNLKQLSRIFKDGIAHPAKITIVNENGGCSTYFPNLPQEILLKIIGNLRVHDVMNLAKTCRFLCLLIQDPCLWTKLLDNEFRMKNIFKRHEELVSLYERRYAKQLDRIQENGR